MQEIGNAILRTCLDHAAPLFELLRDELVRTGKVTDEDYYEAVSQAIASSHERFPSGDETLVPTDEETMVNGNWMTTLLYQSDGDPVRVFESRARGDRNRSSPMHYHEEDEHILLLCGKMICQVGVEQHVIDAVSGIHIPAGQLHASIPLGADVRLLIAFCKPSDDRHAPRPLRRTMIL